MKFHLPLMLILFFASFKKILTPSMTKFMIHELCFPYFTGNNDFFIFKKKNKINNFFVTLVLVFLFEKIVLTNL